MAGAGLGLLIGWIFRDPLGAHHAASLGTVMTPAMEGWAERIRQEFQRRGQVITDSAALSSQLEPDEVIERLLTTDGLDPLVMRVLEAAGHTDSTRKLRILGTILGQAISNRAPRTDEHLLIVATLDDLEPAHLRVLEVLEHGGLSPANLENAVPDLTVVGRHAGIGGLLRHGLAVLTSPYGVAPGYEITEFGRAMLEVIRLPLPDRDQ
jgi:hypothetical protein